MEPHLASAVEEARAIATPLAARLLWSGAAEKISLAQEKSLRVALCGTFTTQALEPYVGTELLRQEIFSVVQHSPYNQIHAELLSNASTLRRDPAPEVVVILWRMEDLLGQAMGLLGKDAQAAR